VSDSDATLVDRARAGDRSAFDVLLRRHHPRLVSVCARILGNRGDAEDAAQNALISIVRNIATFDGRSSFGTWAHRIAANAALDELRKRIRRPTPADDGRLEVPGSDATAAVDARLTIAGLLVELPEEFREAVVMRDILDLEYDEIASTLGVPVGTVRSRIARGRGRLADLARDGNQTPDIGRPNRVESERRQP
jgi:RNA polymerase sigma-70 factor (ECF subfamily)